MPSLRCLLLASSLLFGVRPAAADPASATHRELSLSWVRSASASSCPDVGHVASDVERRLGWSPFVRSSGATESIEAAVERNAEVFRASIELRAADGTSLGSRTVESPASTCASLAAAAGLAIALMIEPLLPPEPPVSASAVAVPPAKPPLAPIADGETESAQASDTSAVSASRSAAGADPQLSVALGGVGFLRVLPRLALGVTLLSRVRVFDDVYVVVSGSLLPEQHILQGNADVGFAMTLGAVGGCYRIPVADAFSISSCASLLLASMQVIVKNPEPVDPGSRLWWAGGLGLHLGWNAGHFEAALGIDALGHPLRHSYLIDRAGTISSTSAFVEPAIAAAGSILAGVRY